MRPHLDPHPLMTRMRRDAAVPGDPDPGAHFARLVERHLDHDPDSAVEAALAAAEVRRVARVVYSSNAVFLLELDAPDQHAPDGVLRAVYKPHPGERPLWDFPGATLHLRELASHWLDAEIGYGLVPETVLRDGPLGIGSVQRFVHPLERTVAVSEHPALEQQLGLLATLDVIGNNADRKHEHLLVDRDVRLWGIDNALTFLPYPRQRTVLLTLGGTRVPEAALTPLRSLAVNPQRRRRLARRLRAVLDREEVEATLARIDELVADPVFPVLDPWDGRPFEGW